MRALVTGATGFIGSHLVEALASENHQVRVLLRPTSDLRWIKHLPLEHCKGDVSDPFSLKEAVKEVDWIFHVAGLTKARTLGDYVRANAQGTKNLLEACARVGVHPKRIVILSSLAAWGPSSPGSMRDDFDECCPVSAYGISKATAEKFACLYAQSLPIVILRPTAVYGPRDRDILVFFKMIGRGLFFRVGKKERHVCMIHVADVVQASLLAVKREVKSGSIYNLSDGSIHTWREICETIARLMGKRVKEIVVPKSVAWLTALTWEMAAAIAGAPPLFNREKLKEMLQDGWVCSIERARKDLGFEPKVGLEEGLRQTLEWYQKEGWV